METKQKLKRDKTRLKKMQEESITMEFFLLRYLGIFDNAILSSGITHENLIKLFPQLVRTGFDYVVDNPDLVYSGEVLLVEDCLGRTYPYFNPKYIIEYTQENADIYGEFVKQSKQKEIPRIEEIDLPSLKIYELQELLHIYENNGMRSSYRKVRMEIINRDNSKYSTKQSKGKALKKERKRRIDDYE